MKLRNKKTGDIKEIEEIMLLKDRDGDGLWEDGVYKSLAELNEEWEDCKDPLIKDEKIRKAVRLWAEANDFKKCIVRIYDYDRCGVYVEEGMTAFVSCDTQLAITFFNINLEIKTEEPYTIAELCGKEQQ